MKTTKRIFGLAPALRQWCCHPVGIALACSVAATLKAQNIYVAESGNGVIGEYGPGGQVINASLITGFGGGLHGIAISGNRLFVVNSFAGTVGEYTLSGAPVNTSLITGLNEPFCIAISGTNLFVSSGTNTIGEYSTSGATINASLITTGLNNPLGIAISGTNLFVVNWNISGPVTEPTNGLSGGPIPIQPYGTVAEYTTSGATVAAPLISGLWEPSGIAVSGTNLFIPNNSEAWIGEYTTSGETVNPSLIYGLGYPEGMTSVGTNLFVAYSGTGNVGDYTTSGATVNASLISGLNVPLFIAIGPPAPQLNVTCAGNQIVISYPAWATNYVLQSATAPGSANWQTMTNGLVIGVTNVAVTVTNDSPARFFRLGPG